MRPTAPEHTGIVTSIRGSVVDLRFDDALPSIYSIVHTGREMEVTIEILMQLDQQHERPSARERCRASSTSSATPSTDAAP
nr:hypothetical protein [Chlorobaculum sp. 24CR]